MFMSSAIAASAASAAMAVVATRARGLRRFILLLHVADRPVAPHAREPSGLAMRPLDGRHDLFMALAAGTLGHVEIPRDDVDLIGEAAGGERERVTEAVFRLHQVFRDQ